MRLRSSDASVRVPVWVCGNSCYPGWGVKYPVRSRRLPAGAPATGFRCPRTHLAPGPTRPGSHAVWPLPARAVSRKGFRISCVGTEAALSRWGPEAAVGPRGHVARRPRCQRPPPPRPPVRPGAASRAGAGFPSPAPNAPLAVWGPRKGAQFPPSARGGRLAGPLHPAHPQAAAEAHSSWVPGPPAQRARAWPPPRFSQASGG